MQRTYSLLTCFIFLFLGAPVALGHEHVDSNVDTTSSMADGMVKPVAGESYWNYPEHTGLIYAHIGLMIVAWVLILPPAIMLSIARSRLTLPAQFLFHVLNGVSIFLGFLYDSQTPDLYQNKSHGNLGWVVSVIAAAWTVMAVIKFYGGDRNQDVAEDWRSPQSVSHEAMAKHRQMHGSPVPRWSHDSGQGSEPNTASLFGSSRANSWQAEHEHSMEPFVEDDHNEEDELLGAEKTSSLAISGLDKYLSRAVSHVSVGRWKRAFTIAYIAMERCLAPLAFCAIVSGIVVYSGIFQGHAIFNGLAHFIKGGIFFWYGLLSFGRWMGCFGDFGWAWNRKPGAELVGKGFARIPSAEFTESFVIFLYGASNVFLEHLGGWGKAWSMRDLEHVSITILFFGGGLLGMLIDSKGMRNLLNGTSHESNSSEKMPSAEWKAPNSYNHPLNPMPALVILLLGVMMSSHHQHSSVSTAIHKQWGTMFVGFALARGVTYITFWLKPPTSYLPGRPPSEIIAAFCLIGGGVIFMASNSSTVDALESYGLDAMFVFTVTMGLTALLMAWALSMMAIKAWAAGGKPQRIAIQLGSSPA